MMDASQHGYAPTPTPICAIGASAGGIVALQDFFAQVDTHLGAAYVVIVHLAPDRPSALSEILATRTHMPVLQVESTAELRPNHVYVISPDRELVIRGDDVVARPFTQPRAHRAPIDMFFRSVAAARGDGIAIVLSGSGSDGALGVRAVKEAGGLVFVQEPTEAEYPAMPRSAIATGMADFVAPVTQLTARATEVMRSKDALRRLDGEQAEQDLRQIIALLRTRTGHDFLSYKRATVMRRIARRMQVARQTTLQGYFRYLQTNPDEAKELFNDLLISVTQFFRDRAVFTALAEKAIVPIFDRLNEEAGIRVWVLGCATGEEAYSIGILLLEEAARRNVNPQVQIFASDLDEAALRTGREGRYPRAIEADVSEERLRRFFIEDGAHYRVKKELRDLVLFASHSVLKDPPFIKLDLIACRNLMIYLQRDLQRQLCNLCHYALKPNGFLLLGSAETAEASTALFAPIDRDARLYVARELPERVAPPLMQLAADRHHLDIEPRRPLESPPGVRHAHAQALEQHAPPSVLVDASSRIMHLSPSAGRFFLPSEGPFTPDLPAQVRPELRVDLKLALQRAFENNEPTLTIPLPVAFNGGKRLVALNVIPAGDQDNGMPSQALVVFLDAGAVPPEKSALGDADLTLEEVRRLREELSRAQERLSISRQQYEQATQDLRAANEELQSINEEYRSTAEELETSKEELQSMNEELQTVNAELKANFETISSAHKDLHNLVAATEIGTLFVDPELRIKLFTPAVTNYFNITNADIGRSISDFTHRLLYEGLEAEARRVLSSLIPIESEVLTYDNQWLTVRLRPYRSLDDRIEGVVLTFADITARRQAEDALSEELRAMARLQQLSTRIVEASQLEAPLSDILDAAIELLRADFGHIQLYDPDRRVLRTAVQRGFDEEVLRRIAEVGAGNTSASGIALSRDQQVIIEDVATGPAYTGVQEIARLSGYRAVQATPLLTTSGKLVGMLSTHFREPRHFSAHDHRLIDICARQAADAINAYQLQQFLRESEARLRKVLETDAVGVIFFDDTGTLIDANEAFLHMTGYDRGQIEARELTWRAMTPPEFVETSEAQMKTLDETGRIGPYEKQYIQRDGTRRWMLFAGQRIEPNLIVEYCLDISDRKRAEQHLQLLTQELSHRVKNTLTVVAALASQTNGKTVEAFREVFTGRLHALAQAHSILLGSQWREADLKLLVEQAMNPYRSAHRERISTQGPSIPLPPKQALGLSLILHELATNALKYGALSAEPGHLNISWQLRQNPAHNRTVRLRWEEHGGPAVQTPGNEGFGSRLILRATEGELGGEAELSYAAEGLTCRIEFPLKEG
jgi:two-component system, chemotaxis family, CheB/CheR fusion protein